MILFALVALAYVTLVALVFFLQRSLLYFPSHHSVQTSLSMWTDSSRVIGYCREVSHPQTIWLMTHGNGGQAAQRDYVLQCMSTSDSLYVLEYPGYGSRDGNPTRASINAAAIEAYRLLRAQNPGTPVCVVGESLGSGPATVLAMQETPPEKIVLVVPYDTVANVGSRRFPFLPVRLLLLDRWDNIEALKNYAGPIDIFATRDDEVIPFVHAQNLAAQIPQARFTVFSGGHNHWADSEQVRIER
jgi:pimeloyl-ACP methyl ester carboxylesterase